MPRSISIIEHYYICASFSSNCTKKEKKKILVAYPWDFMYPLLPPQVIFTRILSTCKIIWWTVMHSQFPSMSLSSEGLISFHRASSICVNVCVCSYLWHNKRGPEFSNLYSLAMCSWNFKLQKVVGGFSQRSMQERQWKRNCQLCPVYHLHSTFQNFYIPPK